MVPRRVLAPPEVGRKVYKESIGWIVPGRAVCCAFELLKLNDNAIEDYSWNNADRVWGLPR